MNQRDDTNNKNCRRCGQLLMRINGNRRYWLHLCNNDKCELSHQPQGYSEKPLLQEPDPKPIPNRLSKASYGTYCEQRKINYRALRDLGLDSKEAAFNTSNKHTKELQKLFIGR